MGASATSCHRVSTLYTASDRAEQGRGRARDETVAHGESRWSSSLTYECSQELILLKAVLLSTGVNAAFRSAVLRPTAGSSMI